MIKLLAIVIVLLLVILTITIILGVRYHLKVVKQKDGKIYELENSLKYHKEELKKRTNEEFDDYLHLKHK